MKTMNVLSALFVSSALLTTACTPRDVKVVDDKTRVQILNKKNRGKGGYQSTEFKIGSYSISTVLMEKQIEAIELTRLALGFDDGVKTQYQISNRSQSATEIESVKDSLEYSNDKGGFKGVLNKKFEAKVEKSSGILSIKAYDIKSSSDATDENRKKFFVNLRESFYEVTLKNLAGNDKVVEIEVTSKGSFEGAVGAGKAISNFTASLIMNVDKESLATNEIKINSIDATTSYDGLNTKKPFTTTISGKNLVLNAEGLCNKLTGVAVITSDKSKKAVSFEGDQIKIGDRWTSVMATCGKRPTVDLSRLLFY